MSAEPSLVPELAVTDCDVSARFWRDLLGFEVLYDRPEEGFAYLALGEPTSCSTKPTSAGHGERHPSTHPWGAGSTSKSPCPMSPINSGSYAKRAGHCSWSQKRSGTASARAKRRAFASSSYRTPTAT